MTLSDATNVLITQAYKDLSTALTDDGELTSLQAALVSAQNAVVNQQALDLKDHTTASTSAHAALVALANELGFTLPQGF